MTEDINLKRLELVKEHIQAENEKDLDKILSTWGQSVVFHDAALNQSFSGTNSVRDLYAGLFNGFPDLQIEITNYYLCKDAVVVEVTLKGTHLGSWNNLPITGKPMSFPLCSIFTFDEENKLVCEKVYYDRVNLLAQLGLFPLN